MEHPNIRVLLVAGYAEKASDIKNFLQQSAHPAFLVHHYDSPQKAVDFLVESKCGADVILLDLGTVEQENAKRVFEQVHFLVAHIPMIILTGAAEDDMAMLLVQKDISDNVTRETFRASPEKIRQSISEFAVSRNDILKGHKEIMATELKLSEEKAATESRYVHEQFSASADAQVRKGVWLNGGYYVHRPQNPEATELKVNRKSRTWGQTDSQKITPAEPRQPRPRVAFKLQGRVNGGGTTPSMQLMPYKPRDPKL